MASQQISIRQDVYNRLKQAKRPNESFSDTISRLLDSETNVQSVLQTYGTAKSENVGEEKAILEVYTESSKEIRALFNRRLK